MRRRRVAATPMDRRLDGVRRGEQGTRSEGERPGREQRGDVERDRAVHPAHAVRAVLEQTLVEHEARSVEALLAGLEHQQDPTGEVAPPLLEQSGGAEEHRDMGVVPAGVHHAVDLRCEVEPGPSWSGSASMSARRSVVGPGAAPSMTAVTEVVDRAETRLDAVAAQDLGDRRPASRAGPARFPVGGGCAGGSR